MTRFKDGTTCARCGEPAQGYASINGDRYCHGDDQDPSCYELAQWQSQPRIGGGAVVIRLTANGTQAMRQLMLAQNAAAFTCAACHEDKPIFDAGPTASDGSDWCQDCAAEGEVAP